MLQYKKHIFSFLLLTVVLSSLFSQSIVPKQQAAGASWLQNSSTPGFGDQDQINVIFFEIPDTVTSTLYFAVNDPGTDNNNYASGAPDEESGLTDFYLLGGSGVLSNSSSRLIDYSTNKSLARTGTILSSFTANESAPYNNPADGANYNGWYYFPVGVNPSQGEHIGNKYYFKIVTEAYTQQAEITDIDIPAIPADETYFYMSEPTSTTNYCVWFDVNDDGTFSADPGGFTNIRVQRIGPAWSTAGDVAADMATAIDLVGDFNATVTGSVVTATHTTIGAAYDSFDNNSGVSISVTQQGSATLKNAYQLDLSTTNTAEPTGLTGAKSFAYSLNICLQDDTDAGAEWQFYPFVPDSALDGDYVMYHNFDFEGAETLEVQTLTSYTGLTDPTASANGAHSVLGYELAATETASGSASGDERNGTWQLFIYETNGAETPQNSSEIWFSLDGDGNWDTEVDGDPLDLDSDAVPLKIYNDYFVNPNDPDHIAVTVEDGVAITGGTDTERVSIQTVGADGTPLPFTRKVWFDFTASHPNARITATNNNPGPISVQSVLITTSSDGVGWIEISDTSSETVKVTPVTDGQANGSDSLGGTNETADVIFQLNPAPVLSSQFNTTFTEGNSVVLSDITITDSGTADITAGNDIRIHIPAGLNAAFADATVTCTVTGTGVINSVNPYIGTLTYPDAQTALLNVTTSFASTDTLVIEGLEFTNVNTDSSGYLEMSVTGAAPYPIIDDKVITINDSNTTYVWQGADTSWNTPTNWSPNGVPDLTTENAVIPDTAIDPVLDTTGIALNNLTINAGATVDFNGNDIDVNGTFNNDGILYLDGAEVTNIDLVMDTDSGTVIYNGTGTTGLSGGNSYFNLDFSTGTNWVLNSSLTVNNDFAISGTADLDAGGAANSITVSGDWNITSSAGTPFTHNGNTVVFNDSSKTSQILGSSTFFNLTSTTASKNLQFESGQTQIIDTGGTITITGTAGNLIILEGTVNGTPWTLQNDGSGQNISYVSVEDGDVTGSGASLYASNSTDVGGNNTVTPAVPIWDFSPTSVWNGSISTDWAVAGNWSGGVPTAGIHGIVPDVSGASNRFPVLTAAASTNNLTIDPAASVDIAVYSLTIGGIFSNEGTLYREGAGTVNLVDIDSGTVVYRNAGGQIQEYGATDYYNLQVLGAGLTFTYSAGPGLAVGGTLTVTADQLNASTYPVSVSGTSTLGGDIVTNGADISLTGALTLTAASQLTTGGGAAGNVLISNTVDGAFDLTAISGSGTVTFLGNIGTGTALGSLLLSGASIATLPQTRASVLEMASAGPSNINVDQAGNIISSFAASVAAGQSISLTNNTATLTIPSTGTVVAGHLSAVNGSVVIENNGIISIEGNINAGTGSIAIDTLSNNAIGRSGAFTLTASTIGLQTQAPSEGYAGNLANPLLTSGTTTLNLGQAGNPINGSYISHTGNLTVNTIFQSTNFPISFTASGDLIIPATGINTGIMDLTLSSGTSLSIPGALTSSTGNIALTANSGNLSFNNVITKTGAGNLTLTSSADITDGASGYIVNTAGTTILNAGGLINLDNASNNISNMSITSTGNNVTLSYGNPTALATTGALNNFSLSINPSTLTLNDNLDIDGVLTVSSGTLDDGNQTMNLAGNVDFSGGALVAGGTAIFDGTSSLTSNGQSFNNVSVTGTSLTLADNLDVNGNLTVSAGTLNDGGQTMTLAGDVNLTGGALTATGTAEFDGTTTLTSAAEVFNNVNLGTTTGGILTTADQMEINGAFTIGNLGATTLDIDSDTLLVAGNLDLTNLDTFTVTGSTVVFDGTTSLTSSGHSFNNVSITGTGVTLVDGLDVNGNLTVSAGTLNDGNQTMTLAGNVDFTGGALLAGGTAIFNGTSNLTSAGETFNNVSVTGTGLTLVDGLDVNGNLTVSAGTLNDGGQTMTLAGDVNLTGGTLSATGTAEFDGTTTLTSAAEVFNNVNLGTTTGGILTTADQMEINGAFTIGNLGATTLDIDSDTLLVAGNLDLTNLDTFTVTGSTVVFDGTTGLTSSGHSFNNISVTGTGLTLADGLDVNGNLTVSAGTLNDGGQTVTLAGNFDTTGGALTATGTMTFDGAGTSIISGTNTFRNLTCITAGKVLSFQAAATQTIAPAGTMTITGSAGNLIELISNTPGSQWTLDMQGAFSIDFALIVDSAVLTNDITPTNSTNGGNNAVPTPGWVFPPVVWTGATSTDWGTGTNWNTGTIPQIWDDVTIANVGFLPATLDAARTVDDFIIQASASVDTAGNNLTLGTFSNDGTLFRQGGDTVSLTDIDSGTVVYNANTGLIQEYGGTDYFNLQINSGASTFTTGAVLDIAGGLTITAGVLDLGGQAMNIAGDFVNNGTFTPGAAITTVFGNWSSTGTFNSAGSDVVLGGGTAGPHTLSSAGTFNDLTIVTDDYSSAAAIAVGGVLQIDSGSLTHTNGVLSAGILNLLGGDLTVNAVGSLSVTTGDFTINAPASTYTGTGNVSVTTGDLNLNDGAYTGSGDVSISTGNLLVGTGSYTGGGALTVAGNAALTGGTFSPTGTTALTGDLQVTGGVSSTLTSTLSAANADFTGAGSVTADSTLTISGNLSMSAGTLTGGGAVDIGGNVVLSAAAAAFNGNGRTINVAGDWDETAAVFTAGNGTVIFDGTVPGLTSTNPFFNFTLNGTSVTLSNALDVNGSLTITAGTLLASGQQINCAGNWINSDTFTNGGNHVVFDGPGSLVTNGNPFNSLDITSGARTSGAAVTVSGLLDITGGSLTHTGGVLSVGTLDLTGGNLTVNTTGSLSVTTGHFTINAPASTYTGTGNVSVSTGNLNVSDGAYTGSGDVSIATGNLLVGTGSYTGSGALTVAGNATLSGGTFSPTGTTALTGDLQVTGGVSSTLTNTLSAANAGFTGAGSVTADNTLTISGNLSMSDGTLTGVGAVDIGGNVALSAAAAIFNGNGRTINVAGDWDETAAVFTAGNGTVIFDGTVPGLTSTNPFFNFTLNGTSVTLSNALDVNGSLTISAGTLLAAAQQINCAGNWSNSGTFTHGSNHVIFDGAGSVVTNGDPFNTVDITAGARTSGASVTVSGLLDMIGGSLTHSGGVLSVGTLDLTGGDLTVNTAGSLSVITGDFTINDPASAYTGTGNVSVSTGNLVLIDGSNTSSGALTVAGNATLSGGTFSPTGTTALTGDLQVTGGVSSTLTNTLSAANADFTGAGSVTADSTLTISGNLSMSAGTLTGGGAVDIGGNVVLSAAAAAFNGNGRTINVAGDWDETAAVFVAGTSTVIFDGTVPGLTSTNPFFNFTLNGTSVTLSNALDVDGSLTIAAGTLFASDNPIDVAGNWTNSDTFDYGTTGPVTFSGAGIYSITSGASTFYDLTVSGATYSLNDNLVIENSLTTSGTFQPGNHQITFNGTTWTTSGTFDHSVGAGANSNVIFTDGSVIQVTGSNTFYNFDYQVNGGTIEFEETQLQVFVGSFTVKGDPAGVPTMITLTSINPVPSPVGDGPEDQWIIEIQGAADIYGVIVINSAANIPITPDPSCFDGPLNDGNGNNNSNWLFFIPIIQSWTEDSNGNGRIDRIRVRVDERGNLTDAADNSGGVMNFSGVTAVVDGYTVTGFSRDDRSFTGLPADPYIEYEFHIILEEKEYTDTDATPQWRLTENTTLDGFVGSALVEYGPNVEKETPIDNAAPVFNYTLASAEKDSIFIQFSEYVRRSGGSPIDNTDFTYLGVAAVTGANRITTIGDGTKEIELTLDGPVPVDEILNGITVRLVNDLDDMDDYVDISAYSLADADPMPAAYTDPLYWGETLHPGAGEEHRVSDLALGLTGDAILQPVYATDQAQTDPDRGGIGITRDFTGEGWLQDQPIELTSHINSGHNADPLNPDVDIFFDVNVPASYRMNNDEDGLWLPGQLWNPAVDPRPVPYYHVLDFYGLVASPNTDYRLLQQDTSPSDQLRIHNFDNSDPELKSVARVEFLYYLPAYNLLGARIENSSAADWFRQIKPWSFSIHDITEQVGGVTILRNVINPENGETTNLHYELDKAGMVTIQVFDISGAMVDVLQRGRMEAGEYSTAWDGRNSGGRIVARGVYFIRVVAPGIDETRKVMVVK